MVENHQKITLFIVDDHPLIREGIKSQLASCGHIEIVGEAANGQQALCRIRERVPAVALVDITLPDMSGLETSRLLRQAVPQTRIIILTIHDDAEYVVQALQVGVQGYILKDTSIEEMVRGIEWVAAGNMFFSRAVSRVMTEGYARQIEEQKKIALAPRERQVLALLAQGYTNKEMADLLSLSVRTIETYRERIMRKLDIHTVAGLTRYAIDEGLNSVK